MSDHESGPKKIILLSLQQNSVPTCGSLPQLQPSVAEVVLESSLNCRYDGCPLTKRSVIMDKVLLIDFENVQKIDLEYLERKDCKVFIFIGSSQNKLPFDLVRSAQRLGTKVEWIKIDGTGSNPLDFHIAYYLGTQVAKNPSNEYLILSKDKGFDPLVRYVVRQKVICKRITNVTEIEPAKQSRESSKEYQKVVANLSKIEKAKRPRNKRTLKQHIKTIIGKAGTDEMFEQIIFRLIQEKIIAEGEGKIDYAL